MPRRVLALDVPLAVLVGAMAFGFARFAGAVRGGGFDRRGRFDGPPWWQAAGSAELSWWLLPVLVLLVAGLAVRRWRPQFAVIATAGAAAGYLLLGYPHGPVVIALVLTAFALAAGRPSRRWWPWALAPLAALLLPIAVVVVRTPTAALDPALWGALFSSAAVVGLALAVGSAYRSRRVAVGAERELAARRYAYAERLRIAADVHDIVGHSLSVISMQAGVALHVLDRRPDQVAEALRAIRSTSAGALTELRATLDTFRDPDFDAYLPGAGPDRRAPVAGLDRLDELVAALAAGGQRVRVVRQADTAAWPAAVDQAAYRIVQESLTNVVRHAGGSDAVVDIGDGDGAARLRIADHGPGPGSHFQDQRGEGHGIAGMAERARALGGWLRAGAGPDGGFVVEAELPLPVGSG